MRIGDVQKPLRAVVTDELRSRIISGQLPPGGRLLEEEIAAELGVSRNPVREALQALASEGFVRIEPRRGAHVAVVDERRARELFELRLPLEGLVAELAARRRTPAQLLDLQRIIADGRDRLSSGDLDSLPALNTQFHDSLAAAADNALLASTLHHLSHVVQWVYAARIRQRSHHSWGEHAAMVDAIQLGDADLARQRSEAHVSAARDAFLAGAAVASND